MYIEIERVGFGIYTLDFFRWGRGLRPGRETQDGEQEKSQQFHGGMIVPSKSMCNRIESEMGTGFRVKNVIPLPGSDIFGPQWDNCNESSWEKRGVFATFFVALVGEAS